MTKREQERITRLLADLGHDGVIPALEHAKRKYGGGVYVHLLIHERARLECILLLI